MVWRYFWDHNKRNRADTDGEGPRGDVVRWMACENQRCKGDVRNEGHHCYTCQGYRTTVETDADSDKREHGSYGR